MLLRTRKKEGTKWQEIFHADDIVLIAETMAEWRNDIVLIAETMAEWRNGIVLIAETMAE